MRELALVAVILGVLAAVSGLVEVHVPEGTRCTKVGGIEVCVGHDESGW